jgi:hypothetical protein
MGLLKMRKRKIADNAAHLLEPGETIQQMVMTQTGMSAASLAAASASHNPTGPTRGVAVHALVATDRNVYALWIPAWTAVGGVRSKQPLHDATVTRDGKKLLFNGETYNVQAGTPGTWSHTSKSARRRTARGRLPRAARSQRRTLSARQQPGDQAGHASA